MVLHTLSEHRLSSPEAYLIQESDGGLSGMGLTYTERHTFLQLELGD